MLPVPEAMMLSVAPAATETVFVDAPRLSLLPMVKIPALTVKLPGKLLLPESVSVPAPFLVTAPPPEIDPASVPDPGSTSKAKPPPSEIAPAPETPAPASVIAPAVLVRPASTLTPVEPVRVRLLALDHETALETVTEPLLVAISTVPAPRTFCSEALLKLVVELAAFEMVRLPPDAPRIVVPPRRIG